MRTTIGGGHAAFVTWALSGGATDFYADLRWPGWEAEVSALAPDQGIALHPPPFAREGKDLARAARRPVAIAELHAFDVDVAAHLGP